MNPRRIFTIATQVFWEAVRDRILYFLVFFAGFLALAVRLLPEVAATLEDKISLDVSLAAINVLGLVIAIFLSTALITQEIERRTVYLLLAKPLNRAELIVGKHLGLAGVLAVLILILLGISLLILSWNQIPYSTSSLLISNGFLWLQLCLVGAAGILFSVFASSLLAILLTFGLYLIGSLSQDLLKFSQSSENSGLAQILQGLYLVLPDLAKLDLKNDAVYGQLPSSSILLTNGIYGILYIIILLSLATAMFSRREF
ncbi:MAG: ABC transporter permease [Oscillatoriales cyanobacterium RM2_1_1]|nr:ABC transporter permease [Oscillatoriales cyanobacterium SM2_3_0]NJO46558.1 ABC transporter permease [Oscillatoriales cyanobacterium RM2_1_1]